MRNCILSIALVLMGLDVWCCDNEILTVRAQADRKYHGESECDEAKKMAFAKARQVCLAKRLNGIVKNGKVASAVFGNCEMPWRGPREIELNFVCQ